jgi:UDP-glucuronate decarboxylase
MKNFILKQDMKMITDTNLPWECFANKTVLISGANGLLPAYMVETLLYLNDIDNFNCRIIGLVRSREKALLRFKNHRESSNLHLIEQDVSQPFSIDEQIHYIIHAASQASPKYYDLDPVGTLMANTLGTYYLLELAKKNQIDGFLYFSSGEVYGEVDASQIPTSENMYGYINPLNVRSCYAESKRMGENMTVSYAHQYGVPVKIVRPFHTYGPGVKLDDGRVFADFISDLVYSRDLTILGDGCAVRSFCYLADATVAFFTVLLKGKNAEAYNVGNSECCVSILELADRLTLHFKDKKLRVIRNKRENQTSYLASKITINSPDTSKLKELGWRAYISLEEGFARTVESVSIAK